MVCLPVVHWLSHSVPRVPLPQQCLHLQRYRVAELMHNLIYVPAQARTAVASFEAQQAEPDRQPPDVAASRSLGSRNARPDCAEFCLERPQLQTAGAGAAASKQELHLIVLVCVLEGGESLASRPQSWKVAVAGGNGPKLEGLNGVQGPSYRETSATVGQLPC